MKSSTLTTFVALAFAALLFPGGNPADAEEGDDLLEPERAFRFSASLIDPVTVEVRYVIADGYYMYRDRFLFAASPENVVFAASRMPHGIVKDDKFFGRLETYRGDLAIRLALASPVPSDGFELRVVSQGCADIGVCYAPVIQTVTIEPAAVPVSGSARNSSDLRDKLRGRPAAAMRDQNLRSK